MRKQRVKHHDYLMHLLLLKIALAEKPRQSTNQFARS